MNSVQDNIQAFKTLLQVINEHDYDLLDQIMAEDFLDHHPEIGAGVSSRQDYKRVLKYLHQVLDIKSRIDIVYGKEEKVVAKTTLTGKHIGEFMGIAPTGREVEFIAIDIYRLENGMLKERWTIDDMAALLRQLEIKLPT